MQIDTKRVVIGQYADYIDTGIWTLTAEGAVVAPENVTVDQIKDFLAASGGCIYLTEDRKIASAGSVISG